MKKLFLLVLLAILMPVRTMADHTEDTWLYMVTQQGIDELNIEMPIFDDENFNGWVDDGWVYVTPEGGTKETLLQYRSYDPTGDNEPGIRAFNLNFDGDDVTGIEEIVNVKSSNSKSLDAWFTLDGRRLNSKPSQAGVYVYKGIKVVVK